MKFARGVAVRTIAVSVAVASAVGAQAQVPVISADDLGRILGALAAVIESRAREVAAETLREQLVKDLCTHHETAIQLRKGNPKDPLKLRFGGGKECYEGKEDKCDANDVFVRSCRLLSMDDINVTDPHLLQTVGKETVAFGVRVSAFAITDAKKYDELRLPEVATYVYEMMASLKGGRLDRHAVIENTLAFADSLGRGSDVELANSAMQKVGGDPALAAAMKLAFERWSASCPKGQKNGAACAYVEAFPTLPAGPLDPRGPECTAFTSEAGARKRAEAFGSLFEKDKPFVTAVERSCASAVSAGKNLDLKQCRAAQLGRVLDMLYRTKCQRTFTLSNLRQALYVLYWQRDIYDDALEQKPVDSSLASLAKAMRPLLSTATSAELTTMLKVVTSGVRAFEAAPDETRSFMRQLAADVHSVPARGYNAIFGGEALSWENRLKLVAPVREFRDQVKQLFALPVLMVGLEALPSSDEVANTASLLNALFNGVEQLIDEKESPERAILKAANLVTSLSNGVERLRRTIPEDTDEHKAVKTYLQVFENAFGATSEFLTFVANRDWVAIALGISFEVATIEAEKTHHPQLVNSLAFTRMLMSVYQAKTTDEAKAIFASKLESKSSRRERFGQWAIDVGSTVGGRWGWQKDGIVDAATHETRWNASPRQMGGLHVPVGVQFTSPYYLGILVYAFDVGAYLVATSGPSSVNGYDAIRPGAALMIRPSARYPIDVLVGADYRPTIDVRTPQWRYGFALGLELPLYLIK